MLARTKIFALILVGSTLSFLYFCQIASQSYWLDEMVSIYVAKYWSWNTIQWENHPPLYSVILSGWIKLFGDSEIGTRSLSALFTLASILIMYRALLVAGYNIKYALLWTLLYATNPVTIRLAQETRMYALGGLITNISLYATILRNRQREHIILSLIAPMTHLLIGVWQLILNGLLIVKNRHRIQLTITSAIGLTIILIFFTHTKGLEWQKLAFQWTDYFANSEVHLYYLKSPLQLFLAGLLNAGSIIGLVKGKSVRNFQLLLCIILNLALLILITPLFQRNILYYRYFYHLFIAWCWWTALTQVDLLKHKSALKPILFFMTLVQMINIDLAYAPHKADWRLAAAVIKQRTNSEGTCILTSRTLALRTPYLEEERFHFISVVANPHWIEETTLCLQRHSNIWILDTELGATIYADDLAKKLSQKLSIKYENHSFISKNGESITLILFANN